MDINRRNVLVGIGALGIGGGALFSSGAFTTVEADREVDLNVRDDGEALLALEAGEHGGNIIGTTDDGLEAEVIKLEQDDLNENAETRFEEALDVENNGDRTVEFYVEDNGDLGDDGILDIRENDGDSIVGAEGNDRIELSANGGEATIDIVVNLRNDDDDSSDLEDIDQVTFVAEATDD